MVCVCVCVCVCVPMHNHDFSIDIPKVQPAFNTPDIFCFTFIMLFDACSVQQLSYNKSILIILCREQDVFFVARNTHTMSSRHTIYLVNTSISGIGLYRH